jgi:adenosylcobinamide-GDP ribazoletransferase
MNTPWRHWVAAPRLMPLLGVLIGAAGGGIYWLAAQLWPTSIAVILSMLTTALLCSETSAAAGAGAAPEADATEGAGGAPVATAAAGLTALVFAIFVKYDALMALSAAKVPFAVPANVALGLIMVAGQASSHALVVSVTTTPHRPADRPASLGDTGIALALGFAPAALIGVPGLVGLAGALLARMVFIAYRRRRRPPVTSADLQATRQLTEVCFYLGTLAAGAYI